MPRPVHVGQAPCGELNENERGSSSSIVVPSKGHSSARCSAAPRRRPPSAGATSMTPSPSRSAVSTESARRDGVRIGMLRVERSARPASAWRTMSRSTTTSIVWRLYLSSVGRLVEVHELPVDADAHEALPARRGEDALALRLAVLDERPEHEDAAPSGQGADAVGDLLHGHARDLPSALGAVRMADAREQQAQVVVDLGDRADRRAGVAAGALLVDGDGRREPLDGSRRPASPSGPGTGGRTRTATRRSGAGPPRRSCRTRGWTCRCRTAR